jgi:hypothetical protein
MDVMDIMEKCVNKDGGALIFDYNVFLVRWSNPYTP